MPLVQNEPVGHGRQTPLKSMPRHVQACLLRLRANERPHVVTSEAVHEATLAPKIAEQRVAVGPPLQKLFAGQATHAPLTNCLVVSEQLVTHFPLSRTSLALHPQLFLSLPIVKVLAQAVTSVALQLCTFAPKAEEQVLQAAAKHISSALLSCASLTYPAERPGIDPRGTHKSSQMEGKA